MSGDKSQLDRIEDMLRQLIHMVESTNAAVASLQKGARLDTVEVELEHIKDKVNC